MKLKGLFLLGYLIVTTVLTADPQFQNTIINEIKPEPLPWEVRDVLQRYVPENKLKFVEIPSVDYRPVISAQRANEEYFNLYLLYTANTQSPGFRVTKSNKVYFKNEVISIPYRDWSTGPAVETDRKLDFYIDGRESFFVVELPWGRHGYTRDGRFDIDQNGRLVMLTYGFPVLGENGYIYLPNREVVVDSKGQIFDRKIHIDTLNVITFTRLQPLRNLNDTIFYLDSADDEESLRDRDAHIGLLQGAYENSNTEPGKKGGLLIRPAYKANAAMFKAMLRNTNYVIKASDPYNDTLNFTPLNQ